ncbi:MAG: nucleotidyltransferase domain-containing protein [Chloroflexi bacterium]|nr:nucleotidyltransferase domain-containing protein [Chloroflexota bacterium]
MSIALQVSPEAMAVYRATAQHRWEKERQELARRRERAWQVVRRATALLKEQFGATRVAAFGSLVHGHWFSRTSDIDLAAWGLPADDYFVAVAKLQDLSPDFRIDLVTMESCRPALRDIIVREGEPL